MASLYEQMNNLLTPDSFKEGLAKSAEENKDESMSDIFSFDRIKKEVLPQFREKDEIIEKAKATGTGLLTGTLGIPADLISLGSAATSFLAENTASPTSVLLKDAFEDTAKEWGRPAFDKWFTQTTGLKSNPENEDQLIGEILSPTGTILAPIKFILKGGKRILDLAEPFFKDPPSGGINSLELAGGVADTSIINKAPKLDNFNKPTTNEFALGIKSQEAREANVVYLKAEEKAMGEAYNETAYKKLSQAAKDKLYLDTGGYRGTDGLFRYKIDTKDVQLNEGFFKENNLFTDPRNPTINQVAVDSIPEGTVLKDILVAENLYKQYGTSTTNVDKVFFQRLGNVKIKTVDSIPEKYVGDPTSLKTAGAAYIGSEDTIYIAKSSPKALRSMLLHEVQHAIQAREGFIGGSSPAAFLNKDFYKVKNKFIDNLKNNTENLVTELNKTIKEKGYDFEINKEIVDAAANKLIQREYGNMTRTRAGGNMRIINNSPVKGNYSVSPDSLTYKSHAGESKAFSINEAKMINFLGQDNKIFNDHMIYRAEIFREQLVLKKMQDRATLRYLNVAGEKEANKIITDDFTSSRNQNIFEKSPSNDGLMQGQSEVPATGSIKDFSTKQIGEQ